MLHEQGVVVAVEPGAIWVETVRASTCGACKAKAGCGHHLINQQQSGQRARLRVPVSPSAAVYQVGDMVSLALPEGALMRAALWVYALPLVLLFGGALGGSLLPSETVDGAALFGMAGLLLGFVINRAISRRSGHNQAYQPQVVSAVEESCQAVVVRPAEQ